MDNSSIDLSKETAENKLLFAKINDLIRVSDRGNIAVSHFLTPAEQHFALEYLKRCGKCDRAVFFGGCNDCERKRLFVVPEYITVFLDGSEEERITSFAEVCREDVEDTVTALKIDGSGYKNITHRDFLGAVLSLGIERDAIGDLICRDNSAILFCGKTIAAFLCESLEKVGSDNVKCHTVKLPPDFDTGRQFKDIHDTVASPRLDCVVASLTNLSRDKADELISRGDVELDFAVEKRRDRDVRDGAVLTARGFGKYIVVSIGEETKKGRLRLYAKKYI